ncbi:caprin-1-like isoform X1 [Ptychodera flava]|uniref:caprin-1-like isoform X1 n=1 Tax=Ptychodera flava TaxID=63121 RepID=UPI00396A6E74
MPSASSKQASQTSSTEGTDAMRQSLAVIEKKIRNLEKRKGKLDGYKNMVQAGEELNKDQRDAIAKFDEVVSNLEFAKDLFKQFQVILQDGLKQQKKVAKREQLHRQEHEQKRLKSVLELQDMLEQLGSENVRKDFTEGSHGAITLTQEELKYIDEFYKLVLPSRETEEGEEKDSFSEKQNSASEHLISFLDAKPKDVCGTTYKGLKDIFDRVMACGYLENIPSHSENGETEAEPEEEVEETKETEEYVVVESDEVPPADAPEITSSLPPAELPPSTTEEPTLLTQVTALSCLSPSYQPTNPKEMSMKC